MGFKLDIQKSNNHGIWQRVNMLDTIPHVYCNNFSAFEWLSFWFFSKSKLVEIRDPLISLFVCSSYEDFQLFCFQGDKRGLFLRL